jgi:hypothetical protein
VYVAEGADSYIDVDVGDGTYTGIGADSAAS